MDGRAMGEAFEAGVKAVILLTVLVTATVAGCGTWGVMRLASPTPESIERQKAKQAVIDALTPEQRDALGIK